MPASLIHILHVEDNHDHAYLIEKGLANHPLNIHLIRLVNGAELLDYLYQRPPYNDIIKYPQPDLILLDMRLPKVSGMQVLQTIQTEDALSQIPVIALSTSYQKNAIPNGDNFFYLVKPDNIEQITTELGHLISHCLTKT